VQRQTKKPPHGLGMGILSSRQKGRGKRAAAPLRQRRPPGQRGTQDNTTQREAGSTAPLSAHRAHPTTCWDSLAGIRSSAHQTGDAHQSAQGVHAAVMWTSVPCLKMAKEGAEVPLPHGDGTRAASATPPAVVPEAACAVAVPRIAAPPAMTNKHCHRLKCAWPD
jgi:hypothetical protein